ncbi:hypothetical protein ACO2RV_10370 [Ancylobacter sp. VNQ12]|uniref:hypothetical protein n=1 Tax=Ancylobacter sp. VNQ12 TaxID=3400920 RepID=UPI003BFF939A
MTDNRSPETRFLDDIRDLARMAAITELMISHALTSINPKVQYVGDDVIIRLREEQSDHINFVVRDVVERAQSLVARCEAMEERIAR